MVKKKDPFPKGLTLGFCPKMEIKKLFFGGKQVKRGGLIMFFLVKGHSRR